MRELPCAVCGSSARTIVYASTLANAKRNGHGIDPYSGHYCVNRCAKCGLLYSSPILPHDEVNHLYTLSEQGNVDADQRSNVRETMRLYYQFARPFLTRRERVLDVGCDIGLLLDVARADGFAELHGIEPVGVAAREAMRLPGASITTDFYEDQEFPAEHFDLITLVHVVDHLVEPKLMLDRARKQLRPGGIILAVVHNSASLLARILGEKFPPYNFYHHYFFNPQTLGNLFQKNGFDVVRVASTYNVYSVEFLLRRLPGLRANGKRALVKLSRATRLANRPVRLQLGNIAIVARRPLA